MARAWFGIGVLALAALGSTSARGLDPERAVDDYRLDLWRIEDGLPETSAYTVLQTRDGYLWAGTYEGLVRFDGVRFEVFDRRSVPELRSNVIFALAEDAAGGLWIGTDGGGLTRHADGRFVTYTRRDGLPGDSVSALAAGGDALWIGTDGGLGRFAGDGFTTYATADGLPASYVVALAADDDGVWVGTEHGLARLRDGVVEAVYTAADGLGDDWVTALGTDREGVLWVATAGGALTRFVAGRFEPFPAAGLAGRHVESILGDRDGNLWLGTYGDGLARLDRARHALEFLGPESLSSDTVWALIEDREGSLWLATLDAGLGRLKETSFRTATARDGLPHDRINAVLEDRSGALWLATDGGGLARMADDGITVYTTADGLPSDYPSALHEGRDGTLWVGAFDGLARLRDGRLDAVALGLEPGTSVLALHEDRRGRLWIGTDDGLLRRAADGSLARFASAADMPEEIIRVFVEDRQGVLWIGVDGGLLRFREDGLERLAGDALEGALVRSLYLDAEDTLWIGTRDRGLVRYRDGRARAFSSRDGLASDAVYHLLEDRGGDFWMSSNAGIYRLPRSDLEDYARGRLRTLRPRVFGIADGMESPSCMGGSQPAGWRRRDGRLVFPTVRGAVIVDPDALVSNPSPPPVTIERLRVDRRIVDHRAGELRLPPGRGELELRYTGLGLRDPAGVRFRYRLGGYDESWVDAGDRRVAYYTNLAPGSYRFQVLAANEDGVWNEDGAWLELELLPRFYQTRAFYVLSALALVLTAWAGYGLRVRGLVRRAELLESMVSARTAEAVEQRDELARTNVRLAAAKEAAEGANRAKSRFLASVGREIRAPLAELVEGGRRLREITFDDRQRRRAGTVVQSGEALLAMIDDILDFSIIEAGDLVLEERPFAPRECVERCLRSVAAAARDKNLELRAEIDDPLPRRLIGDPRRLRQILFHLLTNAIEYTERGEVVVTADARPAWMRAAGESPGQTAPSERYELHFAVRDTGVGIPRESLDRLFEDFQRLDHGVGELTAGRSGGTGLGLVIVRQLAELMGGMVWVESELGRGSTFHVSIVSAVAAPERRRAATS